MANTYFKTAAKTAFQSTPPRRGRRQEESSLEIRRSKTMMRVIIKTLATLTLVTSLLAIAACGAAPRQDARTPIDAVQDTVQARVSAVQDVNGDIYLVCLKDASGAVYRCYVPRIDWVDTDATYTVTLDGDQITSIR